MIDNKAYQNLLLEIKDKSKACTPFIVAIDGNSTAGKSTLGRMLAADLKGNLYHMDDFFLREEQRTQKRLEEIGGNVDYKRFKEDVLLKIKTNMSFSYSVYDCRVKGFTKEELVEPNSIHIIEGSYSHHPVFADSYDYRVFMKVDYEKQKERILKRNGPLLYQTFIDEWIPKENSYFAHFAIENSADFVIIS